MGLWLFYGLLFLLLIIFILMVVGLIAPTKSILSGASKTRVNALKYGVVGMVACIMMMFIVPIVLPFSEEEPVVETEKTNPQPPPQLAKPREPTPAESTLPTPEEQVAAANKAEAERQANLLERRKDEAWRDCRDYINTAVTRPLTVKVGMFDSQKIARDKKIVITIDFTAKNALDIAQPLSAYCEYWRQDMTRTAARIIDR